VETLPSRRTNQCSVVRKGILVNLAVPHNRVLGGALDELDILRRVAIDEHKIRDRALFNHAQLAGVGINPEAAINSPLSSVAILSASAGVYQRTNLASGAPCRLASFALKRMSVAKAVLILYFFASL
jgi:hypothetical protein